MNSCQLDTHVIILIVIMMISGAFGGFLNSLHNFDTWEGDTKSKVIKFKYIFLGIGSAFLVPVFLKMIASDLINNNNNFDNNSYLIFGGFCLIAAIFSKRFISSIGERVLEAAKKAEMTSKENKKQIESTQRELTTAQERIEDVKLAVDLKSANQNFPVTVNMESELLELVDSYIIRTTIEDYTERLKVKAELGRRMGQIIIRNNLPKEVLLANHPKEGMYLALSYAVQLKPDADSLSILNRISNVTNQLYVRYVILLGYRTLISSGFVSKIDAKTIYKVAMGFRKNADKSLQRHIDDTINMLKFIDPDVDRT